MSLNTRPVLLGLVLAASVSAQVVYIDDANPATGTSNSFPWAQINGFTTIHVYTAAQLAAGGVCPGANVDRHRGRALERDVGHLQRAAGAAVGRTPRERSSDRRRLGVQHREP